MQFDTYSYDDLVREFCYTHNNLISYCDNLDVQEMYYEDFSILRASENMEMIGNYVHRNTADDQLCFAYGVCDILLNNICSY
jgi:hypothetical protein